jgi:DNA segregation ATPase FtsK/SpoIIIE-like protein
MDIMFWLILAVIIVGYFIYRAIQQNSNNNIAIAQQKYLNSQTYKDSLTQQECDMAYLDFLSNLRTNQIEVLREKIRLEGLKNELFKTKKIQSINDDKPKLYTKKELVNIQEMYIKNIEERTKEIENEYVKVRDGFEKRGFYTNNLATMRTLYNLDSPFPSDDSYVNSMGDSRWSILNELHAELKSLNDKYLKMVKEKKSELEIDIEDSINMLNSVGRPSVDNLVNRLHISKSRALELVKIMEERGLINRLKGKDATLEDAIKIVREYKIASSSLLQRELGIGYSQAARYLEDMEERKIIGKASGSRPREVF